jgi:fumarate hydratase class I
MARIAQEDLADSLAQAFQFVSHHHPPDFVRALRRALAAETHAPAHAAIEQLLVNSRLSALGRRPVCQDTGVGQVFLRVGCGVQFFRRDGAPPWSLQAVADEGVRRAYRDPVNPLRATMVSDPLGRRLNTRDNTPAVVHCEIVGGEALEMLEVLVVAKGGGGDVKARFATLEPSDSVADWVIAQLPGMGAGWCPPGTLGIGIGGTPEQAMLLAKLSLFDPIDMDLLQARGARNAEEALRLQVCERANALGIGAQGLGGTSAVLDVKLRTAPCHAATIPVALVPNCAATRYVRFTLDGSGPARIEEPSPCPAPCAWTSTASAPTRYAGGASARRCCSRAACSRRATPRTSAWWICSRAARRCRWTCAGASSTTWARSMPWATRPWAPRGRPRPRAWIASSSP